MGLLVHPDASSLALEAVTPAMIRREAWLFNQQDVLLLLQSAKPIADPLGGRPGAATEPIGSKSGEQWTRVRKAFDVIEKAFADQRRMKRDLAHRAIVLTKPHVQYPISPNSLNVGNLSTCNLVQPCPRKGTWPWNPSPMRLVSPRAANRISRA